MIRPASSSENVPCPRPARSKIAGRSPRNGFSLIELLVCIAIIAVMVALILPAFSKAAALNQVIMCMSNQRMQFGSLLVYQSDYGGLGPNRSQVAYTLSTNVPSAGTTEYNNDGIDSYDPVAGVCVWGCRNANPAAGVAAGNVNVAKGMGQVVEAGYMSASMLFCPGVVNDPVNRNNENGPGTSGYPYREWATRQWVYGSTYSGTYYSTANLGPNWDGIQGYNQLSLNDTNNYGVNSSYAYRSGDYSYSNNKYDIFGTTGITLTIARATWGFNNGTGTHGFAFADPNFAKPDNNLNDLNRAVLCESFFNQHANYTGNYDSNMVAWADGAVTLRQNVGVDFFGVTKAVMMNTGGSPPNTALIHSGGGSANAASMCYFDENVIRKNRRRGGDRTWLNAGTVAGTWHAGGGNAMMKSNVFNALDWVAKMGR
ncbi:MAG: prepilin-type N-terminal cleavage/methylation domain-containing protein [Planctomycetota bacterium]|nr:prepilin-type N-terminal cleavage/methylation domain-containing protein [Planctomycetota bacterium]